MINFLTPLKMNSICTCAVGWSDFEKNATLGMLCKMVVGPQFQFLNL